MLFPIEYSGIKNYYNLVGKSDNYQKVQKIYEGYMLGSKWKNASIKEQSEVIKNLMTAMAVVVGGGWVLFQWNVLFPKTEAEVISAAASIRADVKGELDISFGDGGATTLDRISSETCSKQRTVKIFISGNTTLANASNLPLYAYFKGISIKSANSSPKISKAQNELSDANIQLVPFVEIGRADKNIMIGGLHENRIEKGQSIKTSFVFLLNLPFICDETEKIVTFEALFDIVPVDPRTGDDLTNNHVSKILVTACQIQPDGYGGCNIDRLNAYGQ